MQKPVMRRSMSDGDDVTIISINSVSLDDMRENLLSPSDICPVPKITANKKTRSCATKLCAKKYTALFCGTCAVLLGAVWLIGSKLESASDRLNIQLHTAQHNITICQNMITNLEVVKQAWHVSIKVAKDLDFDLVRVMFFRRQVMPVYTLGPYQQ